MAFIYKITNDINDKVYIGKTEFSLEKRFRYHCSDAKRKRCEKRPLYNALKKYGFEHFHISLIEETDRPEEREIHWIEQCDSFKNGYNATLGGDSKRQIDYNEVVSVYNNLQNCTEVAKLLNISFDSVRNILIAKGISIVSSDEILAKRLSKPVNMLTKDGKIINHFNSIQDAARYISNNHKVKSDLNAINILISRVCRGIRKTAYGHLWRFAETA